MRLLFITDLHGSEPLYNQTVEFLSENECDVLVMGGDMLPDGDPYNPYEEISSYIKGSFTDFLKRVHSINNDIQILMVFGNHDWLFAVDEIMALERILPVKVLQYGEILNLYGFSFLGFPFIPQAPYWCKDFERRDLEKDIAEPYDGGVWSYEKHGIIEVSGVEYFAREKSMEEMLDNMPSTPLPTIFISHTAPFGTNVDRVYGGGHGGSKAIFRYLQNEKPVLSMHGHIHEAPWESDSITDYIGDSICVNPGKDDNCLSAALWDSDFPTRVEHVFAENHSLNIISEQIERMVEPAGMRV